MSNLFDTGPPRKPTKRQVIDARNWGRETFGCGEDKWTDKECVAVRERLPECFHDVSPIVVKNWCMLSRKNKNDTTHNARKLGSRLEKAGKDYERDKLRKGITHSEKYETYIHSEEWRAFVTQHHMSCKFRCQLCGSIGKLDGHHTPEGYRNLGNEHDVHVLSLCRRCHRIADLLRDYGKIESADIAEVGLPLTLPDCKDVFSDLDIDFDSVTQN